MAVAQSVTYVAEHEALSSISSTYTKKSQVRQHTQAIPSQRQEDPCNLQARQSTQRQRSGTTKRLFFKKYWEQQLKKTPHVHLWSRHIHTHTQIGAHIHTHTYIDENICWEQSLWLLYTYPLPSTLHTVASKQKCGKCINRLLNVSINERHWREIKGWKHSEARELIP